MGDEVDIWVLSLNPPPAEQEALRELLAPAELARAARFHFERDRRRFVAGRAQVRRILARYLQTEPANIEFCYGACGKPTLSPALASSGVRFNLAHTGDVAVLAVAETHAVGVDIELVRPVEDAEDLVEQFFSAREAFLFKQLPARQKHEAFFNLWTRKEAWLKAIGEGIGHSLHQVEVTFLPGEPARLLSLPGELGAAENWRLFDLDLIPGHAVALAAPASVQSVCGMASERSLHRWDRGGNISSPHGKAPADARAVEMRAVPPERSITLRFDLAFDLA